MTDLHTIRAQISPRAPFDFNKTLDFTRSFAPAYGDQTARDGVLTKATSLNGQTIVFSLQSSGTVDAPQLQITLHSAEPLSHETIEAVLKRIAFYVSADDDLLPFYVLAEDDPVFIPIIDKLYGYHQLKFLTPFENACWAILSSRNRRANAVSVKRRLTEAYGSKMTVDGISYQTFPEPFEMLGASPEELAAYVRQEYRARFLHSVIWAFAQVDDDWLKTAPYDEVYKWLRGINGIGEWSSRIHHAARLGAHGTPDHTGGNAASGFWAAL